MQEWETLALSDAQNCPYGSLEARKEALWRTHIADLPSEHASPEKVRWLVECWYDRAGWAKPKPTPRDLVGKGIWKTALLYTNYRDSENDMFGYYMKLIKADWYQRFEAGELKGEELEKKNIKAYFADSVKSPQEYGAIAKKIWEICTHRALFVTSRGYIGLAPWNAKVGDSVIVAQGGKTPFLIRESTTAGTHSLVGEAYVYGIMGGEAFDISPKVEEIQLI